MDTNDRIRTYWRQDTEQAILLPAARDLYIAWKKILYSRWSDLEAAHGKEIEDILISVQSPNPAILVFAGDTPLLPSVIVTGLAKSLAMELKDRDFKVSLNHTFFYFHKPTFHELAVCHD